MSGAEIESDIEINESRVNGVYGFPKWMVATVVSIFISAWIGKEAWQISATMTIMTSQKYIEASIDKQLIDDTTLRQDITNLQEGTHPATANRFTKQDGLLLQAQTREWVNLNFIHK